MCEVTIENWKGIDLAEFKNFSCPLRILTYISESNPETLTWTYFYCIIHLLALILFSQINFIWFLILVSAPLSTSAALQHVKFHLYTSGQSLIKTKVKIIKYKYLSIKGSGNSGFLINA